MTNPTSDASQPPVEPDLVSNGETERRSRRTVVRDESGLVATMPPRERALLVGVQLGGDPGLLTLEDSLTELALLAKTAGLEVVGTMTQKLDTPNPATLIGTGKLEELKVGVLEMNINAVLFDDELSPRQQRELEKALGENVKVVDRTALILDIFASHARTREGAVQVELAQYEYRLPRLTRAWTHLARQAGGRAGGASGGVGVRGPGETQLEVDRREIGRRISFLKDQLEDIRQQRSMHRRQRRKSASVQIALVGYTNAGKSTLLNALSDANVVAENKLFATLDPTTRRIDLGNGHVALLTDTVGFIQKLPTQLVAAFRATLEEVTEADILLHVVDLSHPNMEEQVAAVEEVLEELGAGDKTVITALNKLDALDRNDPTDRDYVERALAEYPNAVAISALTGDSLDLLRAKIDQVLRQQMAPIDVLIPYNHGELVALAHEHGFIEREEHGENGTHLVGRLPTELAGRYVDYWRK
ncbi:MAG TPA: GTPase HflX [Caldilineaceae bacterium]|nr:GTPase HflX [Caldilineaceae bacterium]